MKLVLLLAVLYLAAAEVKQCDMPTRPQICPEIYGPVCGTKDDGSTQTYDNYCFACADADVLSYEEGHGCDEQPIKAPPSAIRKYVKPVVPKCPTPPIVPNDGFTKCGPHRKGIMCAMIYKPVCAKFLDGTTRTEGNACTACTDFNVVGYWPGECGFSQPVDPIVVVDLVPVVDPVPILDPLPSSGKYTFCPTGQRNQFCNKMLEETCGFKSKGLPQNYGNTCTACADPNVFAYIRGRCSDLVKTCPANRLDCRLVRAAYIPSCAFEQGKAPQNVSNSLCCQDSTYDSVITGQCPAIPPSQGKKPTRPVKRPPFYPKYGNRVYETYRDGKQPVKSDWCMAYEDQNSS